MKRNWEKENPEKVKEAGRRKHYKREYGISYSEYALRKTKQGGKCLICGDSPHTLMLDHDHVTGAVRGLLCRFCNSGLGMFKDSIDNLVKAVEYLRGPS